MEITIEGSDSINDIQQVFSGAYPFLRIEFFRMKHTPGKLFPQGDRIPSFVKIGDLVKDGKQKKMKINGSLTVAELENACREMGLLVQVLRRSGRSWVPTSLTDDWSLERQNREGELLTTPGSA